MTMARLIIRVAKVGDVLTFDAFDAFVEVSLRVGQNARHSSEQGWGICDRRFDSSFISHCGLLRLKR